MPASSPDSFPFSDIDRWESEFLNTGHVLRDDFFGISREAKSVRYPVRMLRYWFTYHLLVAEHRRAGRPLDIAELGTHNGQMLVFANVAASEIADPAQVLRWSRWLGADAVPKWDILEQAGYSDVLAANVEESSFGLPNSWDAAVCLHILEHTADPEAALKRIAAAVRPGGAVIGGSPVLPHFLVPLRERQLRRTAAKLGHVSAFSPRRVETLVRHAGLTLEFMSGGFFIRHKGFAWENSRAWLKFNIRWGRAFPWWPGEIHWLARKPL